MILERSLDASLAPLFAAIVTQAQAWIRSSLEALFDERSRAASI
jgi:hypothetical protein